MYIPIDNADMSNEKDKRWNLKKIKFILFFIFLYRMLIDFINSLLSPRLKLMVLVNVSASKFIILYNII